LWNVENGQVLRDFPGHVGLVYSAAISPDGQTLATASHDQTIRLWDLATGKPKQVLKVPGQSVRYIEFSPDGQTLLSTSNVNVLLTSDTTRPDGTIIFWDMKALKEKSRFALPNSMQANRAKYSPDGKTVVIAANIPKQPAMMLAPTPAIADDGSTPVQPPPPMAPSGGRLLFWDVEKSAVRAEAKPALTEMILDIAFGPGG